MKTSCPKMWCSFFKAVHDQHRQHILELLRRNGTLSANQIVTKTPLSQPTVSHHLKILHQAGVVTSKKQGKEVIYSLNEDSIMECCGSFVSRFVTSKK